MIMKAKRNKTILLSIVLFLVLVLAGFWFLKERNFTEIKSLENTTEKQELVTESKDEFKYNGKEGVDALTLLKEKTAVEQDKSGMVVSINGRKADNEKREFWGFYVNGEMAQVGSADFKTKNSDVINWKIENY
jgi:hypothetical protein